MNRRKRREIAGAEERSLSPGFLEGRASAAGDQGGSRGAGVPGTERNRASQPAGSPGDFLVWFCSVLFQSFLWRYNIHKEKDAHHKSYRGQVFLKVDKSSLKASEVASDAPS